MEQSFIAYIENSIKENWDLDALTDYNGATLQYKDVARKIEKVHLIFEASGIKKGDKIAICGRNSSHWGVTFLATLTYGAVAVPILHEFKAECAQHRQPLRSQAPFRRRPSMGKPQRICNDYPGRHHSDDGLLHSHLTHTETGLRP